MSEPPQQLDIFADSHEVRLRNEVFDALQARDADRARRAERALRAACPGDTGLPDLLRLVNSLAPGPAPALFDRAIDRPIDHAAVAAERSALAHGVAPAAQRAFGAGAGEVWLQPLWAALAARCAGLRFEASHGEDHAAPLWLRAGQWERARQAVEGIESWRRIPAPLAWMTHARFRLSGLDESWPLWVELAWLSPARFDDTVRHIGDPLLGRLCKKFSIGFEGSDSVAELAWFPAWVLTEVPALAPRLALAQAAQHSPAERAMRLLLEILGLERQGRQQDLVQRRRALRDLHASLFAAYMATR